MKASLPLTPEDRAIYYRGVSQGPDKLRESEVAMLMHEASYAEGYNVFGTLPEVAGHCPLTVVELVTNYTWNTAKD
jgi:hypothetical protein